MFISILPLTTRNTMKSMGFLQVYLLYVSAGVSTWNSVVRHICRSRITDPLPNYRLAAHYRHRVFISWRVKFCTQGNTCIRYTDIHTERNITDIQYIYVSYMYIRHTDVRQKYLADCVLCCITILFFVIYWIPPTDYLRHKKCPPPWRKGRVTVNGAWI